MTLRASRAGTIYYGMLERFLVPVLRDKRISPDLITLVGFAIAVFVPLGCLVHPVLGMLFILVSGVVDTIDGLASRAQNRQSSFGAFWDSTLDRGGDTFFLLGFWVLCWEFPRQQFLLVTFTLFVAVLLTMLVSYTKARIEGLGGECERGLMERAVRIIYLLAWILGMIIFPAHGVVILWTGLGVYLLLTLFTVLQRVFCARKTFPPDLS